MAFASLSVPFFDEAENITDDLLKVTTTAAFFEGFFSKAVNAEPDPVDPGFQGCSDIKFRMKITVGIEFDFGCRILSDIADHFRYTQVNKRFIDHERTINNAFTARFVNDLFPYSFFHIIRSAFHFLMGAKNAVAVAHYGSFDLDKLRK